MGRMDQAKKSWQRGLDLVDDFSDCSLVTVLESCLNEHSESAPSAVPCNGSVAELSHSSRHASPTVSPIADSPPSPKPQPISATSCPPRSPLTSPARSEEATAALRLQLALIRSHFIGEEVMPNEDARIHPALITAAKQNLSHASGEELVDDLIAVSYLLVNSNSLAEACELVALLLEYRPDLFAGHLALGSAYALMQKYDQAISAFSVAIALDPSEADAWKRRGQTRAAKGVCVDALKDYNKALQLQPGDPDTHFQRGLCYHQLKSYRLALVDLKTCIQLGGELTGRLWNYVGMCESQLGNVEAALAAYTKSVELDGDMLESRINRAQILKEAGSWEQADEAFQAILRALPGAFQTHYYRGLLHYGLGNSMEVLGSMRRFLGVVSSSPDQALRGAGLGDKEIVNALVLSAMSFQTLGDYGNAVEYFNKALQRNPQHICRIQKHILLYYYRHLSMPTTAFNIDNDFSPDWKEMLCKGMDCPSHLFPDTEAEEATVSAQSVSFEANDMTIKINDISRQLSPWVQLNSPGFLPHCRQQRAFGLAVLQMAEALRQHCDSMRTMGQPRLVSNTGSSQPSTIFSHQRSEEISCVQLVDDTHAFTYRDFMDVAVKWRQLSEPNDAVWWIDRLPAQSFAEGFGLHTPIVNGQLKCIRYYSYFPRGLEVLKTLAEEGYYDASSRRRQLSEEGKRRLHKATTLEEVYGIVGADFYVVCPCRSSLDNTTILEGTRLTLLEKSPDGFDFSIRCPGLPDKWESMHTELTTCFDEITALLVRSDPADRENPDRADELLRAALKFFFYWTNFSPLSRGSAQAGYAALMALMLAAGRVILTPIPKGLQFDWEAIFTPEPTVFVNRLFPLISTGPASFRLDDVHFSEGVPNLHAMLHMLNST